MAADAVACMRALAACVLRGGRPRGLPVVRLGASVRAVGLVALASDAAAEACAAACAAAAAAAAFKGGNWEARLAVRPRGDASLPSGPCKNQSLRYQLKPHLRGGCSQS